MPTFEHAEHASGEKRVCGPLRTALQVAIAVILFFVICIGIVLTLTDGREYLSEQCGAYNLTDANVVVSSRTWLETTISAAPIAMRNAAILFIVQKFLRQLSGFGRGGNSLAVDLLIARGGEMQRKGDAAGAVPIRQAGWVAIVGGVTGEQSSQLTWHEACEAAGFSMRQAVAVSLAKLLLWHWSQPLGYLWIFSVYFCNLKEIQQVLGLVVAMRELLYLATTLFASATSPVFLLIDLVTVWKEADSHVQRGTRIALYVLTPHNYVALCLGHRFKTVKLLFLGLAALQVAADFASCFALFMVLNDIAAANAAGEPLVYVVNDVVEGADASPVALAIGYSITAAGFVLFFGPKSVAALLSDAADQTATSFTRAVKGAAGVALTLGLLYLVALFLLLVGGCDIYCNGLVGSSYTCAGQGITVNPTCSQGVCGSCVHGTTDGVTCSCTHNTNYTGAFCDTICAGPHGARDGNTCVCDSGWGGESCDTDLTRGSTGPCCSSWCADRKNSVQGPYYPTCGCDVTACACDLSCYPVSDYGTCRMECVMFGTSTRSASCKGSC